MRWGTMPYRSRNPVLPAPTTSQCGVQLSRAGGFSSRSTATSPMCSGFRLRLRLRLHPPKEEAIAAALRFAISRLAGMRLDGKLVVVDELNGRFGFVAKPFPPVSGAAADLPPRATHPLSFSAFSIAFTCETTSYDIRRGFRRVAGLPSACAIRPSIASD